jgi:hypothetical protein
MRVSLVVLSLIGDDAKLGGSLLVEMLTMVATALEGFPEKIAPFGAIEIEGPFGH